MPGPLTGTRNAHVLMSADAIGGIWPYALDLAQGFATEGISTTLAIFGPEPDGAQLAAARRIEGLRPVVTGLPLEWTARTEEEVCAASLELSALAEECNADIVHLNSPALGGFGVFSVPVVAVAHSCVATWWRTVRGVQPMPDDFEWRTDQVRRGLHAADAVITTSRSFAFMLAQVYGPGTSMSVVHNGRRPIKLAMEARRRCVLTAGRLWDEGKNVRALDAIAGDLDAPVFAAGPVRGPNGAAIRFRYLQPLGMLNERELAEWYATARIFVSTSLYEPFGLSVLEAAQAGAALVLSDIPTFRELWDGAAIFVRDENDLSAALRELLASDEMATALGIHACQRAAQYTPEKMVRGTLDVYRHLHSVPMAAMN